MSKRIEIYNICLKCGKSIKTIPSIEKKRKKKYCSYKCRNDFLWMNPEYREKMSLSHRGKKSNNALEIWIAKNGAWNKGKHYILKSTPNKGKYDKRYDPAYRKWRMSVWMRDDFKCRIKNEDCNGRIEAHHILGWAQHVELRYEVNNGITLCHAHHPLGRAKEKRLAPIFQELVSVSRQSI